jgi:hypothetical protein
MISLPLRCIMRELERGQVTRGPFEILRIDGLPCREGTLLRQYRARTDAKGSSFEDVSTPIRWSVHGGGQKPRSGDGLSRRVLHLPELPQQTH